MKVLIIGSGGRESTIAWKVAQSDLVTEVVVVPGNPGMKRLSSKIKLGAVSRFEDYLGFSPELVIVGPEAALAEGIVDFFESKKILCVGPVKAAAMLETSKAFCKEIFVESKIPTARYRVVDHWEEGLKEIERWPNGKIVVKTDALAQGKGVVVCSSKEEAIRAVKGFCDGTYLGQKMEKLILEEKLEGPEVSAFALCDGENFVYLGSATDYKRLMDDDQGPNTGGMGTISPSPLLKAEDEVWIQENIFAPVLETMKKRGAPFKGFLFAGLMKTKDGIFALEFNTRMGDPETQSLFPRITDDLIPLFLKAAQGELRGEKVSSHGTAVHVVLSADGYPGVQGRSIRKGDEIQTGDLRPNSFLFPAGVSEREGMLVTSGGRVMGLTVLGENLREVVSTAYKEVEKVRFTGAHYRRDIGKKFL
jgi:phosphoribosylamine--glycine ligase